MDLIIELGKSSKRKGETADVGPAEVSWRGNVSIFARCSLTYVIEPREDGMVYVRGYQKEGGNAGGWEASDCQLAGLSPRLMMRFAEDRGVTLWSSEDPKHYHVITASSS
jgi:hypothetical protein